jgi:protein phosphatase
MYVGHVGDSRVYRMRDGRFEQMTADHTMKDLGVVGEGANHLSRAVGLWPTVPIDIVLGKPQPGDVYLLCSDGLTKMVTDEQISDILSAQPIPEACAQELIRIANEKGGKDNVSVVVIRVEAASESRLAS